MMLRGWLVLLMTVYHVMSITWLTQPSDFWVLRFVSGAFIFMSGLAWSGHPAGRRGWRLLVLFVLLNVAIDLSGFGNLDKSAWIGSQMPTLWDRVLWVLWTGHPSASSFGILLPIGLLLVATNALSRYCAIFGKQSGFWLVAAIQGLLLGSGLLHASATLAWISLGGWGLLLSLWLTLAHTNLQQQDSSAPSAGLATMTRIHPSLRMTAGLIGMGLSLLFMTYASSHPAAYAAGTVSMLGCLYLLVSPPVTTRFWRGWQGHLSRLGTYSLPLYILQIVCIHSLWRLGYDHRLPGVPEGLLFLATILFVQSWLCEAWVRLRERSAWADRGYRLVFG